MNKNIQKILALSFIASSYILNAQIKEERLILNKKREPETQKIEKKKTSVETVKNYPLEEKSQNPVNYTITNVPALSDFQTSTIEGEDVAPKIGYDYHQNYVQYGMGNYGKILFDGNGNYALNEKTDIGLDAHVLATSGLKKLYDWDSRSSLLNLKSYLNSYVNSGKLNVTAGFDSQNFNYYGIYALKPSPDVLLKQQVQQFSINAYYDHYSNEILNDSRIKLNLLNDHFSAKEDVSSAKINLSKYDTKLSFLQDTFNADLGVGYEAVNTRFDLLKQHQSNYFEGIIEPMLTFYKGKSYLKVGSGISILSSQMNTNLLANKWKENKFYWFPKAEILFASSTLANLYLGVDGGLILNSYSQMLQENPFIVSDQEIRPTETKYNLYFGIKGDVNSKIKYDVSAGISKINNILYFKADTLFDDALTLNRSAYNFANTYSAHYGNGTRNEVKASVQYFPIQNLALEGIVNYNFYRLDNQDSVLNIPELKAEIDAKYTMLDKKLLLGMNVFMSGDRYTNSYKITENLITGKYESTEEYSNVAGFVDINLSAEYKFTKNISAFATANNILDKKYETFKGYKVLGSQILLGVKASF